MEYWIWQWPQIRTILYHIDEFLNNLSISYVDDHLINFCHYFFLLVFLKI